MNSLLSSVRKLTPHEFVFWGACFEAVALPFSIAAAQWGIGIMFLGWLAGSIREKKFSFSLGLLTLPFLVYIAIFLICSAFAERAGHSIYSVWDNEWLALSAAFLVWLKPNEKELRKIISILIISATLAGVFGLVQHLTAVEFLSHGTLFLAYEIGDFKAWRPVGFFSHALSFGYDFGMFLFLVMGFSLCHDGPRKWLRSAALVIMSLVLIAAFSRSTWYAVIATAVLLSLLNFKSFGHRAVLAVIVVVVALMFLAPQTRRRAEQLNSVDNADRIVYWHIAWQLFLDHPVLGIGADNWDLFFPRYRPTNSIAEMGTPDHPHNEYLNVLSSAGALGLLAFLWIWGVFVYHGLRFYRLAKNNFYKGLLLGGTMAIVCMLIGQMTQDIFHDFTNQLLWWFIVGLTIVAMTHVQRTQRAEKTA